MRLVLLALLGCAPPVAQIGPDRGTDAEIPPRTTGTVSSTTTPADDPRFDPSTWPATLGGDRPAQVFAPADYDGTSLLPVVVLLHGYAVGSQLQDTIFGLSDRVDSAGFLMILPEGNRDPLGLPYWNATPACCDTFNENPDDEGYLRDLLVEAEEFFPVDPDRITFTGHSNGGFMSYRMACAYPDRIAGIASLAGLSYRSEDACEADRAVSVLHIHGTHDTLIPYDRNLIYGGAEETLAWWADLGGCDPERTASVERSDYDQLQLGDETEVSWHACEPGVEAELWRMEGSGHLPNLTAAWTDALVDWLLRQRLND